MPCASANLSCSSLITIRSPFGEMRFGAPKSAAPSAPLVWMLVCTVLEVQEAFAHRRQRRALLALDARLLRDIGLSPADTAATGAFPSRRQVRDLTVALSSAFLRVFRSAADWLVRENLRQAARSIDAGLLDEIAARDPEAARRVRELFDL